MSKGILSTSQNDFDVEQHALCEISKQRALKHPVIQTLVDALEYNDCKFDPQRMVSCRKCIPNISAGFSQTENHIILCQNVCNTQRVLTVNLGHELVHAFDNCRANLDFTNLHHLACTEVRAANLMHCGSPTLLKVKNARRECVKANALRSVHLQTGVTVERAEMAVDNVFDQCYNDLSPFTNHPRPCLLFSSRRNYNYY